MEDYDDMKRKYTLNSNSNYMIQIGLRMGDIPHDIKNLNIHKTTFEINRYIIERGEAFSNRLRDSEASIQIRKNDISIDTINTLSLMDRQIIAVPLPVYLYVFKTELNDEITDIYNETNVRAEILVKNTAFICVCGRIQNALSFRKMMILAVEKILSKDAIYYNGYISSDFLIRNKVRVFFVSKINNSEVILSGRKDLTEELETYLKPKRDLIEQFLLVDTIKLLYMLYYLRIRLEDFMCETDCYMSYETISGNNTMICIKGFNIVNTRKCLKKIKDLMQEIVKITYCVEDTIPNDLRMYTFFMKEEHYNDKKYGYRYLAVGLRSEVKAYIRKSDTNYEIEIDIDPDLEDFLCGKKNGKINKICKDNDCDVNICVNIEDNEKKMVIYIKGVGYNLFKTIEQLENEYPAELSFYLNEKHHRRIIGYGGKNIQKIMKKHGVYIKFMSDEEKYFSGYSGNVIIKTPQRNHSSLRKMKDEVLIMADEIPSDREIPVFPIDYYTYYEFFYDKYKMLYNQMMVQRDRIFNINYYKIFEHCIPDYELNKGNVFIYLENTSQRFMITWTDYDECERIYSENWRNFDLKDVMRLFDTKLYVNYTPREKLFDNIEDYKIDFHQKITRPPEINDENVVGNRRREIDRREK